MKFNFHFGAAASSWLLALLVITAELAPPFKDFLKATFGHHWIGKTLIVAIVFFLTGILLANKNSIGKYKDEQLSWYSVLGSLAVILLFYIFEFVKG